MLIITYHLVSCGTKAQFVLRGYTQQMFCLVRVFQWFYRFVYHVCQSVFGDGENTKVRVAELEEEVQTLKKINKDLYDFSSQLLTKPT